MGHCQLCGLSNSLHNINKRSPAGSSGGNRKWRFLGNVNCGGGDNVDAVVHLLCHGLVGVGDDVIMPVPTERLSIYLNCSF